MVTEDEILQILSQEPLLSPSYSPHKKQIVDRDGRPVLDSNGKQLELPTSYYCSFTNGTQLIIRASNHGTDLDTWVRHNPDPTISLQNVSIVFSNKKSEPELKTEPHEYIDENGNTVKGYRYFVVEEFSYDISNFMKKDVKRIISQLKRLSEFDANSEPVFKDPFKEKPKKRATPEILKPQDKDGKPIPKTTNKVSDRQSKMEESREINMKVKLSESQLRKIIRESLIRALQENKSTIEEGKLGRTLGAAALGAGLMFGQPQQVKAQINPKQEIQTTAINQNNVFSPDNNEWDIKKYVKQNTNVNISEYQVELSIVINTTLSAKELFLNAKQNFYANPTFKYYAHDGGNYEISVNGKNNEWNIIILIKGNKFKITYTDYCSATEWNNKYKYSMSQWFYSVCADIILTDSNSTFDFEEE